MCCRSLTIVHSTNRAACLRDVILSILKYLKVLIRRKSGWTLNLATDGEVECVVLNQVRGTALGVIRTIIPEANLQSSYLLMGFRCWIQIRRALGDFRYILFLSYEKGKKEKAINKPTALSDYGVLPALPPSTKPRKKI